MAYTDIDKPDDYFNTVLYTGNGSTQSITGVGFQPDWTWIKCRNVARDHTLTDSVRGATQTLVSNSTQAEFTVSGGLTSFDSDGFTLGSGNAFNGNTETHVAWNWLASNTTASNTDGSITSTVSASTTSGFSIVSYSGNSTSGATVGHGLGATPKIVIAKWRNSAGEWYVYSPYIGATNFLRLNANAASAAASSIWNNTDPNSTTFTLGNDGAINGSGGNYIAYCFAEKKGFSKFGSYTGNGNADGTFIYTGFKPAMIIIKGTAINTEWILSDNKRSTYNAVQNTLTVNTSDAEGTGTDRFDFFSNGFKLRNTGANFNTSGGTYIYMAFAENPLVGTNNIPATAR